MRVEKGLVVVFLLIASVSTLLAYNYFSFIEFRNVDPRLALHHEILNGQAESPYKYRVLVPVLTETCARLLSASGFVSYRYSWVLSYIVYDWLSITLFLVTLFFFLKEWHGFLPSLIGVLYCAALLPISLRDHWFQPWSLLEAWVFCAAFLAAFKGRYAALVGLTVIASLNRITGLFIPFIYLLGTPDRKAVLGKFDRAAFGITLRFLALVAVSASIAFGIRYLQGTSDHIHTIGEIWEKNTSFRYLLLSFIHLALFAGAGWLFAIPGFRRADTFTRQVTWFIPIYAVPVAVFGVWKEVRLLMPLYPIIISLCLFYMRDQFAQLDSPTTSKGD